jgi:putative phosphoesterase
MKIGIISDVHGDIKRLRVALKNLEREKVDVIICAGDILDEYIYSAEVIKLFRENRIISVLGNHDYEFLKFVEDIQKQKLDKYEGIEYLTSLPAKLMLTQNGKKILVAHSAPWDRIEAGQYTYVYPHQEDILNRMARVEADVLITGHTHMSFARFLSGTLIINPGSISPGRGLSCCSTYVILDTESMLLKTFTI